MREIKFRGKDIKTNEWVYGGYYKHLTRTPCPIGDRIQEDDYKHLIITSGFSDWNMPKPLETVVVDEKTVGQYTGLMDKNSKEICQGDIIKYCGRLFGVEYNEGIASYVSKPFDKSLSYPCCNKGTMSSCEIIGNIYDNQDLIPWEERQVGFEIKE